MQAASSTSNGCRFPPSWPHLSTGLLPGVIVPVFIEFTGPDTTPLMRVNNFHFLEAST